MSLSLAVQSSALRMAHQQPLDAKVGDLTNRTSPVRRPRQSCCNSPHQCKCCCLQPPHLHGQCAGRVRKSRCLFVCIHVALLEGAQQLCVGRRVHALPIPPTMGFLNMPCWRTPHVRKLAPASVHRLGPNSSSMRSNWLYLARRSERQGAPVLICPVRSPTRGLR